MNNLTRKKQEKNPRWWHGLAGILLVTISLVVRAGPVNDVRADSGIYDSLGRSSYSKRDYFGDNPNKLEGWAFSFDNDILVPGGRDQDYTYGVALNLAGEAITEKRLAPFRSLDWINRKLGINKSNLPARHALEFGAYGFTPENKSRATLDPTDRPYASIIYVSAIEELQTNDPSVVWRASLTVGVLGLSVVGSAQNQVHEWVGSEYANGWDNQISDGGEPTIRYSVAHQKNWRTGTPNLEFKTTSQASIGYLTEASYGFSIRYGQISSRWQSFNPELASYREQATQSIDQMYLSESYWIAGVALKIRSYNVFLEGQFKDSNVEYSRSQLNYGILESWVGYSHSLRSGLRITYLLRGHTSEVKQGTGDRSVLWGGLTMSQAF